MVFSILTKSVLRLKNKIKTHVFHIDEEINA